MCIHQGKVILGRNDIHVVHCPFLTHFMMKYKSVVILITFIVYLQERDVLFGSIFSS